MPLAQHSPAAESQDHADLIVALDAGDLAGTDLARAERLVISCEGCVALAGDLAAIRGAMTALPVPVRRRDYQLTPEDAARLRPTAWRRVRDWLAGPGSTVRPLATGLATLGVVGLLLTAGLPGFGAGGAASAPGGGMPAENARPADVSSEDYGATAAPAAPAATAATGPAALASPEPAPGGAATGAGSPAPTDERNGAIVGVEGSDGEKTAVADTAGNTGPPAGAVASVALLLGGLGLFGARALLRRRPA